MLYFWAYEIHTEMLKFALMQIQNVHALLIPIAQLYGINSIALGKAKIVYSLTPWQPDRPKLYTILAYQGAMELNCIQHLDYQSAKGLYVHALL